MRAGGTEEALVEKEFLSDKPGEVWLTAYSGFEFTEALPLTFAFAARERDMRLVGTRLGDEPAKFRRCGDAFLKQKQFGREPDTGKENPGAIEEGRPLKPYRNWRQAQFTQSCDSAFVLFPTGIAQELQSDVPRFGRRPAESVPA